jgi:hypothetical protein
VLLVLGDSAADGVERQSPAAVRISASNFRCSAMLVCPAMQSAGVAGGYDWTRRRLRLWCCLDGHWPLDSCQGEWTRRGLLHE